MDSINMLKVFKIYLNINMSKVKSTDISVSYSLLLPFPGPPLWTVCESGPKSFLILASWTFQVRDSAPK